MWRLMSYLLVVAGLVAGAVWLADHPGAVTVDWLGWRLKTNVPVVLLALMAASGGLFAALRLLSGLLRWPARWLAARRDAQRRKGYLALSDGLAAAAAGQAQEARKQASRAEKLLADPALTGVLSAQTAQLAGETAAAARHFRSLLERRQTAALGYRGLLEQALQQGNDAAAIDLAARARRLSPADPWLADTLFALLVKAGKLAEALDLVTDASRWRAFSRPAAAHRRALLLNAQAASAETEGDAVRAMGLARQAVAADPGLTDASLRLARLQRAAGQTRPAAALLKKAWQARPLPQLARAYADLVRQEAPLQRLRRLERLVASNPDDLQSHLVLGEAGLDAKLWGEARRHLKAVAERRPTATVMRLLARLELAEYKDQRAAQSWLARPAAADPAWLCRRCGTVAADWSLVCGRCSAVDSIDWASPGAAAPQGAPQHLHEPGEQGSFAAAKAEVAQR